MQKSGAIARAPTGMQHGWGLAGRGSKRLNIARIYRFIHLPYNLDRYHVIPLFTEQRSECAISKLAADVTQGIDNCLRASHLAGAPRFDRAFERVEHFSRVLD